MPVMYVSIPSFLLKTTRAIFHVKANIDKNLLTHLAQVIQLSRTSPDRLYCTYGSHTAPTTLELNHVLKCVY
ncbi:hypothetical protein DFH11DRAFT_1632369, partial [Phellopilus nigrolimitatus]